MQNPNLFSGMGAFFPPFLRKKARDAFKPHLSTALMVCFIVTLPTVLTSLFTQIAGQELNKTINYFSAQLQMLALGDTAPTMQRVEELVQTGATEIMAAITSTLKLAWGVSILVSLLLPCL